MFDLENCIGFLTNVQAKKLAEAFNNRLMDKGITRVQWIALYYLDRYESLSQMELAEKLNIKPSSVVRLMDRMERDGLVERVKNPEDRRAYNLIFTDKGREFWDTIKGEGEIMGDIFTKDISPEELNVFINVLEKMVENIK
ncbi:DNA-binding transcriptional regulator, MarR family [Clostridium amylolyticum]|uniref:DNA-binding transcriptional regulator, MarR family n=1 Tax=Clostridium amylolyticum TaxID=1121298 RepID=A0A1M6PD55_9CLOT|nr:MarR family transcriptional regulator [Clostridium amylolyticum]SHK05854.1 DNA-binding transcriptional regulator, MarR family [Clostridium amylolyticum]